MNLGLTEISRFFEAHQDDSSMVLATVIATQGSSYRKPGAMMLIAEDRTFAGLISGGCLEGDLLEHADVVFSGDGPRKVTYDLSSDDESILSLGLGCGGVIHLLLQKLEREQGFGHLPTLFECSARHTRCVLVLSINESSKDQFGKTILADDKGTIHEGIGVISDDGVRSLDWKGSPRHQYSSDGSTLYVNVIPPTHVLVCGAGPDAIPVAELAANLGWQCSVIDHRGAYARQERFPQTCTVIKAWPAELPQNVDLANIDAAVVMSHNLEHDATYLSILGSSKLKYLGLLGPAARRKELQQKLGIEDGLIHGPAGLDIGAELPSSVALSIVAEIHQVLAGFGVREGNRG